MGAPKNVVPVALLRERFVYDEHSGRITYRVRVGAHEAGKEAGAINASGYRQIGIGGKLYGAHRVAWAMTTGQWPTQYIDHINGEPLDNRVENLREATNAENGRNLKTSGANTSGHRGVSRASNGKWRVLVRDNYRQVYVGAFDDFELAALVADESRRKRFGAFAGV